MPGLRARLAVVPCLESLIGMRNSEGSTRPRKNVLFIAVDDLRCNLGCYGDEFAITPNIDRLARRGTLFRRAYCQQAVCSPSRASLMTGRRPDSIGICDMQTHFRDVNSDILTLPEHFKNQGYHTQSIGKVYHGGLPDPQSWSVPQSLDIDTFHWGRTMYALPENREANRKGVATECAHLPDDAYRDGQIAEKAVEVLGALQDRPFFVGVGFLKPHLPFCAPSKYWKLYESNGLSHPIPAAPPKEAPGLALHNWVELRGYTDIPDEGPLSAEKVAELRHGYYACTSFIDTQIGRIMDELARLKLLDKTIVALWGDNGWHLGEHALWGKTTNYELDTRVPLILAAPEQRAPGAQPAGLVEFIDLYPTLVELCDLPAVDGLEGVSMAQLLDDPAKPGKEAVYSQFPRPWPARKDEFEVMGYSMRTDRWRYTEWIGLRDRNLVARELYDHHSDALESVNLAKRDEFAALIQELSRFLQSHPADIPVPIK